MGAGRRIVCRLAGVGMRLCAAERTERDPSDDHTFTAGTVHCGRGEQSCGQFSGYIFSDTGKHIINKFAITGQINAYGSDHFLHRAFVHL